MNERLAFYCDRTAARCHLYTWQGTDGAGDRLFQLWCKGAIEAPSLDDPGQTAWPTDLRPRVAAAGGGLIVETRRGETRPVGVSTELRIGIIPAADFSPATGLLLLHPGQAPEWAPIGKDPLQLGPGGFVLLPATSDDQSDLQGLLDHLERMPGDYRDLVLNVLRRPGIEGALWQLEGRLGRIADQLNGTNDAVQGPTPGPPSRPTDRWPWVLAGLLTLNLLTVLGSTWWIIESLSAQHSQPIDRLDWILPPRPLSPGVPMNGQAPLGVTTDTATGSAPPGPAVPRIAPPRPRP